TWALVRIQPRSASTTNPAPSSDPFVSPEKGIETLDLIWTVYPSALRKISSPRPVSSAACAATIETRPPSTAAARRRSGRSGIFIGGGETSSAAQFSPCDLAGRAHPARIAAPAG